MDTSENTHAPGTTNEIREYTGKHTSVNYGSPLVRIVDDDFILNQKLVSNTGSKLKIGIPKEVETNQKLVSVINQPNAPLLRKLSIFNEKSNVEKQNDAQKDFFNSMNIKDTKVNDAEHHELSNLIKRCEVEEGRIMNEENEDIYKFDETMDTEVHSLVHCKTLNKDDTECVTNDTVLELSTHERGEYPKSIASDKIDGHNINITPTLHLVRERKESVDGTEEKITWQVKQNEEASKTYFNTNPHESQSFLGSRGCNTNNRTVPECSVNKSISNGIDINVNELPNLMVDSEVSNTREGIQDKSVNIAKSEKCNEGDVSKTSRQPSFNADAEPFKQIPRDSKVIHEISAPTGHSDNLLQPISTTNKFIGPVADDNVLVVPLKTNKYAHQCPYCVLWKLKSAFNDHVKECVLSQTKPTASSEVKSKTINPRKPVLKQSEKFKSAKIKISKPKILKHIKSAAKKTFPKLFNHVVPSKGFMKNNQTSVSKNTISKLMPNLSHTMKTPNMELGNSTERSFTWNFEKDVLQMFQSVRESSTGFDVTLACWDNLTMSTNCIQAHKILLSAASPVLRTILYVNTLKQKNNSFVYLNGVSHGDICHILDFIYKGEARIPNEDIKSFMAAANLLKIKGVLPKTEG